jgi:hypothetical protein
MNRALILSEGKGLDFFEFRASVLRIPEVSLKLKEAQLIMDSLGVRQVDLICTLLSENEQFAKRAEVKSLITSVVQIGLFERYLKTNPFPRFMIGQSEGESALRVCMGTQSLRDLIEASGVISQKSVVQMPAPVVSPQGEPILATGVKSASFESYRTLDEKGERATVPVEMAASDLWAVTKGLLDEQSIQQFVLIGPGDIDWDNESIKELRDRTQLIDSIDMDPMLGWFWGGVRKAAAGFA